MGVEGEDQDLQPSNAQGSDARQEKIFVSVRLRPLNEKEIQSNDFADWESNNNTTIVFKNCLGERSMYPNAYNFDRVFGNNDPTRKVYEEAAKEIALSVLNGINSSIFAYGQTSSGKTFTMNGITQYAVADIYDYIEQNLDREYVLKFSALEIYNEHVRDLLSADTTPLRLLDDPERGTVVERLTEEILSDKSQLLELIAVCEAQRLTGETNLNEISSRSHQILRLTIESSARKFGGNSSMLAAIVNFVDLAGSERTSQTLATGARLKEGSHINLSLLTLGKVIRSLSKGRNAHIPYRDSKLTRILQNSLGGNARTAIICTMSPAHGHLEQSRNTLLFANCAKDVTTNAQVNVVMSDKALVKQLRKELAKLESDLNTMSKVSSKGGDVVGALREKELQIKKMDEEIKELSRQRDLAQSKVEELLHSSKKKVSRPRADVPNHPKSESKGKILWSGDSSVASDTSDYQRLSFQYLNEPSLFDLTTQRSDLLENFDQSLLPNESLLLSPGDSSPVTLNDLSLLKWEKIAKTPNHIKRNINEDSGDDYRAVQCVEVEKKSINKKRTELSDPFQESEGETETNEERKQHSDAEHDALVQRIKELQRTIDMLVNHNPLAIHSASSTDSESSSSRGSSFSRSLTCKPILTSTPTSGVDHEKVYLHYRDHSFGGFDREMSSERPKGLPRGSDNGVTISKGKSLKFGIPTPSIRSANLIEMGDTVTSYVMRPSDCMSEGEMSTMQSPLNWLEEFESQQKKIIELWNACHIPLVHRTYFYLLFKGDPSDKIYMEVELRRLSFIKNRFDQGQKIDMDGQVFTSSSSMRALTQEREMLTKQMYKKIPSQERESVFKKWGIAVNSKQRRLQLARKLWTDTKDMQHIRESANLVAKLVDFVDDGQVPKEMFVGPSVFAKSFHRRSYSWK